MQRSDLKRCSRIVVKLGTSTVTYPSGRLNIERMDKICRAVASLHNRGVDVLIVSSGAVGAGMGRLRVTTKPVSLPDKQAFAAVGQGILMQMYEKLFAEYDCTTAQVLLTRAGFNDRTRYFNLCSSLNALSAMDVIPVINENDVISVDELKFGDNDTLSALVACAAGADLLIILSDIDGLYDSDPRINPGAKLISEISVIPQNIRDNSSTKGSSMSSGGMYTKICAADVVLPAGIPLVIASGSEDNILTRIISGEEVGTLFMPQGTRRRTRKPWIAASRTSGAVTVDSGAAHAIIENGANLFAKGITAVDGEFEQGRVLAVLAPDGEEIACGLSNFDSRTIRLIAGRSREEIERLIGPRDFNEVIHHNNMVLFQRKDAEAALVQNAKGAY